MTFEEVMKAMKADARAAKRRMDRIQGAIENPICAACGHPFSYDGSVATCVKCRGKPYARASRGRVTKMRTG